MNDTLKLLAFVKPYWKRAVMALVLLTTLVFLDLSIPRLIQRLIDQGIEQQNQQVVIQTSIAMLIISAVSMVIAIGNNVFSVQVGEATARDGTRRGRPSRERPWLGRRGRSARGRTSDSRCQEEGHSIWASGPACQA